MSQKESRLVRIQISIPKPKRKAETLDELINEKIYEEYRRNKDVWGGMRGYVLEALRFYERARLTGCVAGGVVNNLESDEAVMALLAARPIVAERAFVESVADGVVDEQGLSDSSEGNVNQVEPSEPLSVEPEPKAVDVVDTHSEAKVAAVVFEDAEVKGEAAAEPAVEREQPLAQKQEGPVADKGEDFPEVEDMFPNKGGRPKPNFSQFSIGR